MGPQVSAPYATTVLNGRRVFSAAAGDPRTEIWLMLYAQVMQADNDTDAINLEVRQAPGVRRALHLGPGPSLPVSVR